MLSCARHGNATSRVFANSQPRNIRNCKQPVKETVLTLRYKAGYVISARHLGSMFG